MLQLRSSGSPTLAFDTFSPVGHQNHSHSVGCLWLGKKLARAACWKPTTWTHVLVRTRLGNQHCCIQMGPTDVQIGTTNARTKHPSHCTQTQKQTLGNNNQVARAGHTQVCGLQDLKGWNIPWLCLCCKIMYTMFLSGTKKSKRESKITHFQDETLKEFFPLLVVKTQILPIWAKMLSISHISRTLMQHTTFLIVMKIL